jgi:oligopeptide/dipeptide ABC transporter ATP-binding protein
MFTAKAQRSQSKNNIFDSAMTQSILEVHQLKKHFPIYGGVFRKKTGSVYAVDGISLTIQEGKTLGLVGESGCGKTTVGRAILRLIEPDSGTIRFAGQDIMALSQHQLRGVRKDMQIIFQDPFESLDARQTIGSILEEPYEIHKIGTPDERRAAVQNLLDRVGMPENVVSRFAHEFSGGQRQRIGIARAIALNPRLIVCDEPVSALDVSIQSQIVNLLLELQRELKLSYLFIAHNLAVVKHISDDIAVMYLGRIVEYTDAESLYAAPLHPYTQALISAIPIPDPVRKRKRFQLAGDVPSPAHPPAGCHFHPRCPFAEAICRTEYPVLTAASHNEATAHQVACHRAGEVSLL